ncbi:hypothetical protein BS47DRAFT_1420704, partial [Hydnum rufescens UP504]
LTTLHPDVHQALLAIKTLGRHPDGSAVIVGQSNLQILSTVITAKQDPDASNTAQRCVANALLLQDSGRDAWLALGGGEKALFTLQGNATMEQVFLSSRILFLVTLKPTPFLRKAVEGLGLIDALAMRLDSSLAALVANEPFGKDAHIDILKVIFNVMTQYSRMVEALPGKSTQTKHLGELWDDRFENIVNPLIRSLHLLPPTSSPPLQAPLTHVLHALINVPITTKWFSSALPPPTALAQTSKPIVIDTVRRLFDLFSFILEHYIAYDPDDAAVRAKCREEGVVLDELVVSIPIILARLAKGDVSARSRLYHWILPQDLDRSKALEKRHDTLGRCLRLMSSIHHPHLKETIGDLMFAVCDEDAAKLTAQIGYGNAAGFLFNKGMMAPPGEAHDANGVLLNPSLVRMYNHGPRT